MGETVTSLQRATLIPGGSEALLYATVSGSLGVLLPFTSREDHDFFQHLEMHMRSENPPLCGRDHLSFRSYYYPVKVSINTTVCNFNPYFRIVVVITIITIDSLKPFYKVEYPTVSQQLFSRRVQLCYTVGRSGRVRGIVCGDRYGGAKCLPPDQFLRVGMRHYRAYCSFWNVHLFFKQTLVILVTILFYTFIVIILHILITSMV